MADSWHVQSSLRLREGVASWNRRRKKVSFLPNLAGVDFFELLPERYRSRAKTSRPELAMDSSAALLAMPDGLSLVMPLSCPFVGFGAPPAPSMNRRQRYSRFGATPLRRATTEMLVRSASFSSIYLQLLAFFRDAALHNAHFN
ncbi:hypothetical protein [Paracoccus mutanolyticus]